MTQRNKRLKLPHGETDPAKTYVMANPDALLESAMAVRSWLYALSDDTRPPAPTKEDFSNVLMLAEDYIDLTTYALGQEHCVGKLRDIWRARRAKEDGAKE